PEAQIANMGIQSGFHHRGIRFPSIAARDELIEAVRQADIVGFNTIVESACALTERVFSAYDIEPMLIFEANIRRVIMFSQKEKFMAMLQGRKVLLIGSLAPIMKSKLEWKYRRKYQCDIVGAISIHEYEEIARVKDEIQHYEFDLCLLAAGVNAVILASYIAQSCGKVAFDMGSGLTSLMTGEIVMDQWLAYIIGLDKLFKM
ncbi:MAG TPA: GT-D fold domain-containing glycosyltransferase, partial [Syntrophomonadaceae bacterium]|nr:GT-D fold domain-containing glycosyltransferase [Syntrophomonadaceae bacterium]